MIRIRSVDTDPVLWPSRLLVAERAPAPAERFARCATVVTELYGEQLRRGEPVPARTSWVRFIPADGITTAGFDGVPFADGLGEVHEVPYDPTVLTLPDPQRRRAILDRLQEAPGAKGGSTVPSQDSARG